MRPGKAECIPSLCDQHLPVVKTELNLMHLVSLQEKIQTGRPGMFSWILTRLPIIKIPVVYIQHPLSEMKGNA